MLVLCTRGYSCRSSLLNKHTASLESSYGLELELDTGGCQIFLPILSYSPERDNMYPCTRGYSCRSGSLNKYTFSSSRGNMMRAWDGTLSAAEFEKAAVHLVKVWERQCPNSPPWTWQRRQQNPVISPLAHVVGYLELQDVHLNSKDKDTEILDNSQDVDEDEDPATMHADIVGEEEHCYTYHVIYNESYRVPMLFLHGCLRDGRLLQWQDVLQDLPLGSQHLTGESRWTFLTQEDHPILHRPWFALHPCGTSSIMSLVYSDQCLPKCEVGSSSAEDSHKTYVTSNSRLSQDQSTLCKKGAFSEKNEGVETAGGQKDGWMEKYILTWLSFACPAVGVKIPLRFLAENMQLNKVLVEGEPSIIQISTSKSLECEISLK